MRGVTFFPDNHHWKRYCCNDIFVQIMSMDYVYNIDVKIPVQNAVLLGELVMPFNAKGIVVFAHGSGSSRLSPRNRMVAQYLHKYHFGTLLFDLLTKEEDEEYSNRFNIDLLTKRLIGATEWLNELPATKKSCIGYFGASTGAAAALRAASVLTTINAVVSRGGRPDLAMDTLPNMESPVLLIVGELDYDVIKLNRQAYMFIKCEKKLEIISGATHLFEEPGAMEQVCRSAVSWFQKYLQPVSAIK